MVEDDDAVAARQEVGAAAELVVGRGRQGASAGAGGPLEGGAQRRSRKEDYVRGAAGCRLLWTKSGAAGAAG